MILIIVFDNGIYLDLGQGNHCIHELQQEAKPQQS